MQIPALDGSAEPWVTQITKVVIKPAVRPGDEPDEYVRKFAWKPLSPLSVYDDMGAFITLCPRGIEYKITSGVEKDPRCIGSQWVTMDAQKFVPPYTQFAVEHAPARNWIENQAEVDLMQDAGYLRGMSSVNTMIADDERWICGAFWGRYLACKACLHSNSV